jgi:hypothetical protein
MNLENYKTQTSTDKFFRDGNSLGKQDDSYNISYREFLKYFSDIKGDLTAHHIIIGINFTYGWMPTIFEFKSFDFSKSLQILNKVKEGPVITTEELAILKTQFNNSLVGTSKLLHFINPEKYAIWDSRVFRYLTDSEPHYNRINNTEAYIEYLKFCDFLTQAPDYKNLHSKIELLVKYPITYFRSAELIMFNKGIRSN